MQGLLLMAERTLFKAEPMSACDRKPTSTSKNRVFILRVALIPMCNRWAIEPWIAMSRTATT